MGPARSGPFLLAAVLLAACETGAPARPPGKLRIEKTGAGEVRVDPPGIVCGEGCDAQEFVTAPGTVVQVSASPAPGHVLDGIEGDPACRGGEIVLGQATCIFHFLPESAAGWSIRVGPTREGTVLDPEWAVPLGEATMILGSVEAPQDERRPFRALLDADRSRYLLAEAGEPGHGSTTSAMAVEEGLLVARSSIAGLRVEHLDREGRSERLHQIDTATAYPAGSAAPAPGGGAYVLVRERPAEDSPRSYVLRLGPAGEVLWARRAGGEIDLDAIAAWDGDLAVIGSRPQPGFRIDLLVGRVTPDGALRWGRSLTGIRLPNHYPRHVVAAARGGELWVEGGGHDPWVIGVSPSGELLFSDAVLSGHTNERALLPIAGGAWAFTRSADSTELTWLDDQGRPQRHLVWRHGESYFRPAGATVLADGGVLLTYLDLVVRTNRDPANVPDGCSRPAEQDDSVYGQFLETGQPFVETDLPWEDVTVRVRRVTESFEPMRLLPDPQCPR